MEFLYKANKQNKNSYSGRIFIYLLQYVTEEVKQEYAKSSLSCSNQNSVNLLGEIACLIGILDCTQGYFIFAIFVTKILFQSCTTGIGRSQPDQVWQMYEKAQYPN